MFSTIAMNSVARASHPCPEICWCILVLLLLIYPLPAFADKLPAYPGHRAAVWLFEKDSHKLAGFAEAAVKPERQITLQPTAAYSISFALGKIEKSTFTDFKHDWQVYTTPITISHGAGSSEGTLELDATQFNVEWGTQEQSQAITFVSPVAKAKGHHLAQILPNKLKGTADELEDLILAAAEDDDLPMARAVELYDVLARTTRAERWQNHMQGKNPHMAAVATAVLAKIGQPDALKAFTDACLSAKGNEQVGLIEVLCQMPQSDACLAAMVKLVTADREYLLKMPDGIATADKDRRYQLLEVILKYPPKLLEPYSKELTDWAQAHQQFDFAKRLKALESPTP